MLRKKALRKIFITTMSLFIIMTMYMIPLVGEEEETLKTNLEIEYVTGLGNHSIYLLNENNYLVKAKILLDSNDPLENIKTIIINMTISDSSKFPDSLKGIIPKKTKLLNTTLEDKTVTLNFSKEFLNVSSDNSQKLIEAIVYSLTELKEIDSIIIQVEGENLTTYPNRKEKLPNLLTRELGINKRYDLTSTKDINKVVIYYLEELEDEIYYVPVTKYLNDSRDKIEIIIEELTTGYIYEPNLMSFLREDTELIEARCEDELFILNFNDALFDTSGIIKEEVLYTISYSVFDNYDVNMASFRVNDKEVTNIKKDSLP